MIGVLIVAAVAAKFVGGNVKSVFDGFFIVSSLCIIVRSFISSRLFCFLCFGAKCAIKSEVIPATDHLRGKKTHGVNV